MYDIKIINNGGVYFAQFWEKFPWEEKGKLKDVKAHVEITILLSDIKDWFILMRKEELKN
jgi:hypothetical protein